MGALGDGDWLCSLRQCFARAAHLPSIAATPSRRRPPQRHDGGQPAGYPALPAEAYTGAPAAAMAAGPSGPPGMEKGVPVPYTPRGPWSPPGLRQPWPEDEYLRDGGDEGKPAGVGRDWEVVGLEMEDTVAHYDTVDGRTVVEPSNEVFIYSPRFGAVRQVVGLMANDEQQRAGGVQARTRLQTPTTAQLRRQREAEHPNPRPDRRPAALGDCAPSKAATSSPT